MKTKHGRLELIWGMHEHNEKTNDIHAHQRHYVSQINAIAVGSKKLGCDDELADDELRQCYMSFVGALAWLILRMLAICVYVPFLHRHEKAPTVGHVRHANRLLV